MSYTVDRPTLEKNEWSENMDDVSFDGAMDGHQMTKGLGQLTDGIVIDNRTSSNATRFGIFHYVLFYRINFVQYFNFC